MTSLIAVSGYAGVGKDEFARGLAQADFHRVAFADKMREALAALNPIIGYDHQAGLIRLADVIPPEGDPTRYTSAAWTRAKEYPEVRALLQRCGTEMGRRVLGADLWVNATLEQMKPGTAYVVTDCRFPNEAEAVQRAGGIVVRIERAGVGPVNDHESEIALDDWAFDAVVLNDGSITALHRLALMVAAGS